MPKDIGKLIVNTMGHFLADQRYGTLGSCHSEQVGGFSYCPNPPTNTAHPNIDVQEAFNPNLTADPFRWIPKGLIQDLMDNGEPAVTLVNDQVSGFTISQIFASFQTDVITVQQYKARLITQNPNTVTNPNLSFQISNLFASYNY